MYDDRIFAQGIHSVLLTDWKLVCKTPLAIRNGWQISYRDAAQTKTRYRGLELKWESTQNEDQAVTALHYGYEIRGSAVHSFHFVPPSSLRGALRSWTIRHLVQQTLRGAFAPISSEDATEVEQHNAILRRGLAQRASGCELIASLFGLAADENETGAPANAGRLTIETERFAGAQLRPVDVSGVPMTAANGPDNVQRQMPVRNPVDRITQGSRDGGLHRFLEVARGQAFRVRLRIVNPLERDLGLLGLWEREINDGMLRVGALASIGRGRVAIQEPSHQLWRRPNAPQWMARAQLSEAAGSSHNDDVLEGLWTRYVVPSDSLIQFANQYLTDYTGGSGDVSLP